jgi:hypothetical protein
MTTTTNKGGGWGGGGDFMKKKACSNLQEGWDGANQMDTINMGFFCNYVWEQGFFSGGFLSK